MKITGQIYKFMCFQNASGNIIICLLSNISEMLYFGTLAYFTNFCFSETTYVHFWNKQSIHQHNQYISMNFLRFWYMYVLNFYVKINISLLY